MFQHYADLFKIYWFRILVGAVVAGAITLVLSTLLLVKSPSYTASVTMNMQPSEQALTFNREFLGQSQFNPATIIAQTHIERLLSRPVAERTLEKMLAQAGDEVAEEPSGLAALKAWLWRTYTRANYGTFKELSEHDKMVNTILGMLTVEAVEGSYILRLSATFDYPDVAARIANFHAESYIEIVSEEVADRTSTNAVIIRNRIAERQGELDALFGRLTEMRENYAISDLQTESEVTIQALQDAVTARGTEEIDLILAQRELSELEQRFSSAATSRQGPVEEARNRVSDLQERVSFRDEQIAGYRAQLADLGARQAEFDDLDLQSRAVQSDLAALRQQLLQFELGAQAQAGQVQILAPATTPVYPSSPKVLVYTVSALITGALLVALGIVMQDLFGTRVRTASDLAAIVGGRALPTIDRSVTRGGGIAGRFREARQRRMVRRFMVAFGQKMSAEAGWKRRNLLVTGFLEPKELIEVRNFLGRVVQNSVYLGNSEDPFRVTSIGPIHSISDWDNLPDGQVIVVMHPLKQNAADLDGLTRFGEKKPREPLFVLWE
ncbi:hypothetical protein [uncultured Maritimibacter sp.]|jgi:uncharacterized protein involved in exopolysaccharide biosynthesis|uniref:GumC family protein n=1 Tax=uncultured Maritimibacter sp. TaxID=991866 RepID=UPI000A8B819E|nr:hypothetical protein [uncultured Maritimibacter sp.]